MTEIDQQTWKRLSIGKAGPRDNVEVVRHSSQNQISSGSPPSTATFGLKEEQMLSPQSDCRYFFFSALVQIGLHGNQMLLLKLARARDIALW